MPVIKEDFTTKFSYHCLAILDLRMRWKSREDEKGGGRERERVSEAPEICCRFEAFYVDQNFTSKISALYTMIEAFKYPIKS